MSNLWHSIFILTTCIFGYVVSVSKCPSPLNFAEFLDCTVRGPQHYPVAYIENGRVGGKCVFNKIAQCNVCSWLGIKYAEPPLGNLRFMPPKSPKNLTKTYWGFKFGNVCIPTLPTAIGYEDCLHLNVFVPEKCTIANPCSVMVWIHGGIFVFGCGDSDLYGPDNLLANGIIVVTINYRLGPFGFLNTEDENIPGNAGLLDQNFALKWVNKNIAGFGGDATSITIFGESAGAASVCFHCLSDISAGLFQKAIMQSGSCLSEWAVISKPRQVVLNLAKKLGITETNITEITAKLQEIDANFLNMKALELYIENLTPQQLSLYPPSIDYNGPPFLPDLPRNIVNHGLANNQPICHNAEVITGMNTDEGGVLKVYFLFDPTILSKIENNNEILTPLKCDLTSGSDESVAVGQKVFKRYFSNSVDQWSFYKYATDMVMLDGIITLLKALVDSGKDIYHYNFDYCAGANYVRNLLFPDVTCESGKMGAIHMDEIMYEFTQTALPSSLSALGAAVKDITQNTRTPADLKLGRQIAGSFANLAKWGSPNPEDDLVNDLLGTNWLPVTNKSDIQVLKWNTAVSMIPHPRLEAINFWENVCNAN